MKFYLKFLTFSRGKQIAIVVCLVHVFAVFALLIHHLATSRFRTPKPMIVRTVQAVAERKIEKVEEKPAPKKATVEKAQPLEKKPEPAQKPKAPVLAKKSLPKAIEPPPKAVESGMKSKGKEERVLKEISESLEALTSKSRKRSPLTLPSEIQLKEPFEIKEDPTYGEFLISYLQSTLDLPEYGEVKAKIEIDRFGKLIDCEILEAKSIKNGEFLKNQLPDLTYPCLNDFGIVDATHTFTITFRNVENR